MTIDLFVYGTLMSDETVAAITGRTFARRNARLPDFERLAPAGGYPYVVPRPGAFVDGVLLLDVDASALAALDAYEAEGDLYRRQTVTVISHGTRRTAATYVGNVDALMRIRDA